MMERNCLGCFFLEKRIQGSGELLGFTNGEMRILPGSSIKQVIHCGRWGWDFKIQWNELTEMPEEHMTCDEWKEQDERVQ